MKSRLKITFNAPVTIAFVFICFIVTFLGVSSGGAITRAYFMVYRGPWNSPFTYLRLFTHVLGHSGWDHFIGNAAYILLLGPLIEERHGSRKVIYVILVTALVTGLVNILFFPTTALCGASGVVFAFIIITSLTGFRKGEIPLTFILVAVIFLGQQILDGVLIKDNISNISHIVGGIIGAIVGYRLNRR